MPFDSAQGKKTAALHLHLTSDCARDGYVHLSIETLTV
jgi:hypothetical protein